MFEGRQFLIGGFLEGGCVIIVVFHSFALQLGVKFSEAFGVVANEVCYALTLPLGRGSQLGLGPRDNGQERNGLPDPGSGPKDR